MIKSKLIELFRTFDSNQLEYLRKWVNSPMHNRHKDVIKLIDFLIQKPKITARTVSKEKAFKYLYPKRTFDDLRLRHVMTLAVTSIEEFVGFSSQKQSDFHQTLYLAAHCRKHALYKLSSKYLRKLQKSYEKQSNIGFDYHLQGYQLYKALLQENPDQSASYQKQLEFHFEQHHTLTAIDDHLDYALNSSVIVDKSLLIEQRLKQKNATEEVTSALFKLYVQLYQLLKKFDKQSLEASILLYHRLSPNIKKTDCYRIHSFLCSIIIASFKTDLAYLPILLSLYNSALDNQLLLLKKTLSSAVYWNILALKLKIEGHVEASNFVNEYTDLLNPSIRQDYNRCARAYLLCAKGADKAAQLVLKTKDADQIPTQLVTLMQLKIYFENHQFRQVLKGIASLDKSDKNNNIVQFVDTLAICTEKAHKQEDYHAVLRKNLSEKHYALSDKIWLMDQLVK